jgi:Ca-activated chloride channel family protein
MPNTWMDNIEFACPWAFTGLLFIPLLIVWYIKYNAKSKAALSVSTVQLLRNVNSWRTIFYPALFILRCLGLVSLVFAIAGPQLKFQKKFIEGEGIDIMLCMDISGSMKTGDIKPTRLQAAIEIAKNFVRSRVGDQLGIVVFSSNSLTLCPLTIDTNAMINQINNIKNPPFSEGGTVIGSGLAACINNLRSGAAKTKIIILITDGENSEDAVSPLVAGQFAQEQGIRIYTIGIGTNNALTHKTITNNAGGPPILIESEQKLNEPLLRSLASETRGEYFNATSKETLEDVFKSVNTLEKSRIITSTYALTVNKNEPLLLIAFSLIFIELCLRYILFRKFP